MKTFTQQEIAKVLKTDSESVFKRMTGRLGVLLQPSIVLKTPIKMLRTVSIGGNPDDYGRGATNTVIEEELSGVFGIGGIRPLKWNEIELAQVTFGEWPLDRGDQRHGASSGVLLYQGEYTYMVKAPLKIRKHDLIVTEEDLIQYGREVIGVTFELPHDEPELEPEYEQPAALPTQDKLTIKLPRLKYYTSEQLAEYWRNELGIADVYDSVVAHYVNEGMIKTSLRYEWPDGRGWFFEDHPGRTFMIDACTSPPVEKYYIRLEEAERFEKEHFGKLLLPEERNKASKGVEHLLQPDDNSLLTTTSLHDSFPKVARREVIPLRVIRFITCGRLSADVLLMHLLHERGDEFQPLYAYRKDGSKIPSMVWHDYARMVQGLSETPDLRDDEWIEKSNNLLPAAVFVWRDDFDAYWQRTIGFGEDHPLEEPGERELVYPPIIPNKLLKAAWEGFELPEKQMEPVQTNLRAETIQTQTEPEFAATEVTTPHSLLEESGSEQQNADIYIAQLRKKEPDEVVAVRLIEKFHELNGYDCMKLLDPQRVQAWEESSAKQGRPRQWFYELRKKGLRILEDRENMTMSEV